jgi:hypothetical protein
MSAKQIPADKINLKLILVSGKTKEFLFLPSDSVSHITQHVYDNWPADWLDEHLPPTNILRLIYQGRFLHGNVTLGALQLMPGSTTVMHLVMREQLPEPNYQALQKDKSREDRCPNCCCTICWQFDSINLCTCIHRPSTLKGLTSWPRKGWYVANWITNCKRHVCIAACVETCCVHIDMSILGIHSYKYIYKIIYIYIFRFTELLA